MGKILDFLFSDTWEEYQRIQLYKKAGKKIDKIDSEKLNKLIKEEK